MASGERFYHDVSLRGPIPDRLLIRLPDLRQPDPEVARRLAAVATAGADRFFEADTPSFAYAHGFGWLAPLSHAENGRHVAGALFEAWLAEHGRYAPRSWAPVLTARRTEAMLVHAPLLLEGRDAPLREQFFGTLIRQVRHLAKSAKRASQETRLAASVGLMIGALALPAADDQERAGKAALASALAAVANGQLPGGLRRPAEAQRVAASLLALDAAFTERGLTPPPGLADATGVMRLYLGALCLPGADTLAVLPAGETGDAMLLGKLRPLRRPEGDALLARYGYAMLSANGTRLHVDLNGSACGAFALSHEDERIITSAGAPGTALRALSPRMRDWADALSLPAASATLDARGYSDIRTTRQEGPEGTMLTMFRRSDQQSHDRRLFLARDGQALIGEEETSKAGATYRFPLPPGTEPRLQDAHRLSLPLPSGRMWRFETANASVSVEDGIWSGGGVPASTRQIVVVADLPGLRWALRRA